MLLGTVVQVALDAPSRRVSRGDDSRSRRGELGAAFGVCDCSRHELRELPETPLRIRRQGLVTHRRDTHGTPQAVFDEDGRRHRRPPALCAGLGSKWSRDSDKAADPGRAASLEDLPSPGTSIDWPARPAGHETIGTGPHSQRAHRAVGFIAAETHPVRWEQSTDAGADLFEHDCGRCVPRHECCYPSEGRLLVSEPTKVLAGLTVRDRGREKLRELGKTIFDVVRERRAR
jgi:hypothetical protein